MNLKLTELLELVLNDERYAEYIIENVVKESSDHVELLEIPRSCFTAHQLRYNTVQEMSKAHRSVLLGGIPDFWSTQHQNGVSDLIFKLSDRTFKRTVKKVYDRRVGGDAQTIIQRREGKGKSENQYEEPFKTEILFEDGTINCEQGKQPHSSFLGVADNYSSPHDENSVNIDLDDGSPKNSNEDICLTVPSSSHQQTSSLYYSADEGDFNSNQARTSEYKNTDKKLVFVDAEPKLSKLGFKLRTLQGQREQIKVIPPQSQQLAMQERLKVKNSGHRFNGYPSFGKNFRANLVPKSKNCLMQRNDKSVKANGDATLGKIVKVEKMLVMVKEALTTKVVPSQFSENEPIDTRIRERWKEYITVARATGNPDAPLLIQFYTSKNIREVEKSLKKPWYCKMQFSLDSSCYVDFYSLLDKSICIVKQDSLLTESLRYGNDTDDMKSRKHHKQTFEPLKVYILRCNNLISSNRWLVFLRTSLGKKINDNRIDIRIPEADINFNLTLSPDVKKKFWDRQSSEKGQLKLIYFTYGYKILQVPFIRCLYFLLRDVLTRAGKEHLIEKWDSLDVLSGLTWKHYDRFELALENQQDFLFEFFVLSKSYLLEYRTLFSYPRTVQLKHDVVLEEPDHIEGFLGRNIISSNKNGLFLPEQYFRLFYWFTSNGLLFFIRPLKATPPLSEDLANEYGFIRDKMRLAEISKTLPKVFEHNPYALDGSNHIAWLKPGENLKNFKKNDSIALKSFLRKISLITQAQGCIDLTKCRDISLLSENSLNQNSFKIWNELNNAYWKSDQSVSETRNSIIQIKLENTNTLLLMAPDPFICTEWLTRLRMLSTYWTARLKADQDIMWSMKNKNLRTFNIDETQEKYLSASAPKWMTEISSASELMLDTSTPAISRSIIHYGYIYHKSRKHSVFRKYLMILVPEFIVLYRCSNTTTCEKIRKIVGNEHYMTIPIQKCYIYSGSLTEQELLERDKDFNSISPGSHGLFRVYEDGWKSMDEESSRTFVLWFPSKRLLLERADDDKPGEKARAIKVVSKLGVLGRSMVFMCRSRQERDLWMKKLYEELERSRFL